MRKKNKKIKFLMLVIICTFFIMPLVVSEDIELATLDYQEQKLISAQGNVTLSFLNSTCDTNDVNITWRIYDKSNNITIFYIESKEITIDYDFINDTKKYRYIDVDDNKFYVIYIDYSMVTVPQSMETILNNTIHEKDLLISELNDDITVLKNNISDLENIKKSLEDEIKNWKTETEKYKQERDDAIALNTPLQQEIDRLNDTIEYKKEELRWSQQNYSTLTREKNRLNETYNQMRDPFSLGYTHKNVGYWPTVNIPMSLFFVILTFVLTTVIIGKIKSKKVKNHAKEYNVAEIEPARSHSFIKSLFSPDQNANKRLEIPTAEPLSFEMNPDIENKIENTKIDKVIKINWTIKKDGDKLKTWGYNGEEPIKAKKTGDVWEIFVDNVKQSATFGTALDVYNNIKKFQKEYHINSLHKKIDNHDNVKKGDKTVDN